MPPLRLPPSLTTQTTRRLNLLTSHTKPYPPTTIPLAHPIKPNTFYPHRTTTTSSQPTPSHHTGGCYCTRIRYTITLPSGPDSARTSLCHCKNCKKFTGGPFGVTTKIPSSAYTVTSGQHLLKIHEADNGSGTVLHREFCSECGSGILEFGVGGFPWQRSQQRQDSNDDDDDVAAAAAKNKFVYVFSGTLDKPDDLPPKGEFFCSRRDKWMPEVPGIFHKQKIQE